MVNKTFLKNAISILHHYGFENFELISTDTNKKTKLTITPTIKKLEIVHDTEKQFLKTLKKYVEKNIPLQKTPALLYHINQPTKTSPASLEMHVIGADGTIAEMILISVVASTLRANNINEFTVYINSLGEQDSKEKFTKDLKNFFKKHEKFIPPYAQKYIQQGQYIKALKVIKEKDPVLVSTAPSPLDYLTDSARAHLRDIFEFLEYMDIAYELTPLLVGSTEFWQKTLFEIDINYKGEKIKIARGGRYSSITRKVLGKKIDVVGLKLELPKVTSEIKLPKPRANKPKLFVSYIGPKAQLKALQVLDIFYQAGIPIVNAFLERGLIAQMKKLKHIKVPYVVIIGHKEALEDKAIVRNLQTNKESLVPINRLKGYVSRLKF